MHKFIILLLQAVTAQITLVLLENKGDQDKFSSFLQKLADRGHSLHFRSHEEGPPELIVYEEKRFDNVVVFDPNAKFRGELGAEELLQFVNDGGNVLVGSVESEALNDFAYEFTIDYEKQNVVDPFNQGPVDSIFTEQLLGPESIISHLAGPILYKGRGHYLSGKNPLVIPLLVGSDSSSSSALFGSSVNLVSTFQALNNARIAFAGSTMMFSDEFFKAKVNGRNSGNSEFCNELAMWVFQEKSVLKVNSYSHHRKGEKEQHGIYTIKDEIVFKLEILEKKGGKWVPFKADNVLFEAVMLDPYIRKTMKSGKKFIVEFKLPDQYGMFTFKVDYREPGYTAIKVADTVQVRPLRHDQYPRFIVAAYPYYINVFSMMGIFFAFSAVFLLNQNVKKLKTE